MGLLEVHGYAIVSDDDCIADAGGNTPGSLRNEADWTYFQAQLDLAAVTVLGRLGHEANPNARGRLRIVLSGSVPALDRRSDGWWWNPAGLPWAKAIATILPKGGRVAVPGGRRVFDLFLALGYHTFHLTRAEGVRIPGGVRLFSACEAGQAAETVLARAGLRAAARTILDPVGPVSLALWQRTTGAPTR